MEFHSTKHSRGWRRKAHKGELRTEQLAIALHISGRGSREVGGQAAVDPDQKFFTTKNVNSSGICVIYFKLAK